VRQRYFAGIANLGDVSFHASLNAAFARLDACAKFFHVIRAGLGCYSLEHHCLTGLGQVLDVHLEAFSDLTSPSRHPWAHLLGITQASARYFCRRHGTWEQQHGDDKKGRASDSNTCGHVNLLLDAVVSIIQQIEVIRYWTLDQHRYTHGAERNRKGGAHFHHSAE
jgi:hypothetical protein